MSKVEQLVDAGPVNLLALDGGGIRGVSELIILDEIMKRIQHDMKLTDLPRPCDYFHLIGGTSTGGLIALMLGRLRMSTKEALEQYRIIAGQIFSAKNRKWVMGDGAFKATTLEREIKRVVAARMGGNEGERMLDIPNQNGMGAAFVCTVSAIDMAHLRCFRTYKTRDNANANCEIWEAARATTAAPTFFKRIAIGEEGQVKEEFIDAGIKYNNPTKHVMEEARLLYGDDRPIGSIVSIGTGHPGTLSLLEPDCFQKILPTKLIRVLKRIATDCEGTSSDLARRFEKIPEMYFRFNVTRGVGVLSLAEWKRMGDVQAYTSAYLHEPLVSKSIDSVVRLLCSKPSRNPRKYHVTLADICGTVKQTILSSQTESPQRTTRCSSPNFTGRRGYLKRLQDFFVPPANQPRPRVFLLYGMGGAGKTQICLKFVEESLDLFWRTFWVDATSCETIKQGLQDIADDPAARASGVEKTTRSVIRWLSMIGRDWLLVLDNADGDPDTINEFFPPTDRGSVLITSRNPNMRRIAPKSWAEVDRMEENDAISLLLKTAFLDETSDELRPEAIRIVKELGFLALAIDQAGAAIGSGICGIQDYLQMYSKHRQKLLARPSFKGASGCDPTGYGPWDMSFEAIERTASQISNPASSQSAKSAITVLQIFAFLHHDNIIEEIFKRAAESPRRPNTCSNTASSSLPQARDNLPRELLELDDKGNWDSILFREGIGILQSFSLIRLNASGNIYSVHPLVHSRIRERMSDSTRWNVYQSACALLAGSITFQFESQDYAFRRKLVAHIDASRRHAAEAEIPKAFRDDEHRGYGLVFHENGRLGEAEELALQVAEAREKALGADHPDTLESEASLASIYWSQGRLKEAEELNARVVQTSDKVLGAAHLSTLVSTGELALVYMAQGRWRDAEDLEIRVVEVMRNDLGKEHPFTLANMSNLALTYMHQGKWRDAEQLGFQVTEATKRVFGTDNPKTLISMGVLASIYWSQGRWGEAEDLEVQVMEARKRVLGAGHPSTLVGMGNLASIYRNQGRWKEAEDLEVQVMEARKRVLGAGHPSTLVGMGNLASTYRSQGRWKEAENLEVQVAEGMKMVHGAEHPTTLKGMGNLATTYERQGRSGDAEKLFMHVMEARKRTLGVEHPDTLASMEGLSFTYRGQQRWTEAEELGFQVLEMRKRTLRPEHPDTLVSMGQLASIYRGQGRLKEAEELDIQALEMRRKTLGTEHPSTLDSMDGLAHTWKLQSRDEEAIDLMTRTAKLRTERLGSDHPYTIASAQTLHKWQTFWKTEAAAPEGCS